ncbi:MAG: hypothetical protein ACO1SV_16320 [Fimbriimonas sp.]
MTTETTLSSRGILRFYLPLAISWLFMGLEGPISVGVISRLPNPEVNTAAFLAMMGLAIWIESPVIDLLATATTLGKDAQSFRALQRFVLYVNLWVTAVHALIVLTPVYWIVARNVMALEPAVAEAARDGLALLVPWSALIGWRRYRQGLLIRNGHTRVIGIGTSLRVTVIAIAAISLAHFSSLPSTVVIALALMSSVTAEAAFVHFASNGIIRDKVLAAPTEPNPLSGRRLAAFHFPLTATTMVKLLTSLVIGAGLARTVNGTASMAAYQIAGSCVFLFRAFGFCLPEVVVALYKDEASRETLKRFCLGVGLATTMAMLFLSVVGLDAMIFQHVLGAEPHLLPVARLMFVAVSLAPLLDALQSYIRGVLTAHHLTMSRMAAVLVSTVVLLGTVQLSVAMRWPGPTLAGLALTASLLAEYGVLAFSWSRARAATCLPAAR